MKKLMVIILVVLALFALVWAGMKFLVAPAVEVAKPTRGEAVLAVYATGTVEATVMLPIAPRVSAKLVEIVEDEGHAVTKGQVIARLEDTDVQSSVKQYQAQELLAKLTFERKAMLLKSGAGTKADYDSAKAQWDLAKAQTSRATSEMGFMALVAPDDGEIIKRDGEIGQLIPAQQPVFWMRCCAPLRISVEVNEEDVALVKPQQEVLIRADAFSDSVFKGKVTSITPKGDPVARTYRVRVEFTEKNPLQIGMTAETNIMISKHENALLVPTSAVTGTTVWLVREGVLVAQTVKTGAKGLKQTEILSGVSESDMVVVQPSVTFHAGDKVRADVVTVAGVR
jgi:multidrug efflux system membrane fusion protein